MTWLVLTNASPGAPRNSGTYGDLTTLLDWALVQAGWAIEYTSGNHRVYRPGSGNRFRLYVSHDATTSGNPRYATVRGCENASSAISIIDPFPLPSQVSDSYSNWLVSYSASTLDRPFVIFLSETAVYYFSQYNSAANQWELGFYCDVPTELADSYNTVCSVRNNPNTLASYGLPQNTSTAPVQSGNIYWCRDITGATKSSRGVLFASGVSGGLGEMRQGNSMRAGYQNRIYREKVGVTDCASQGTIASTLALVKRGWLPNAWNPLHLGRGTVDEADTFTDTAYNPSAQFRIFPEGSSGSSGAVWIMETTDTWSPPSG